MWWRGWNSIARGLSWFWYKVSSKIANSITFAANNRLGWTTTEGIVQYRMWISFDICIWKKTQQPFEMINLLGCCGGSICPFGNRTRIWISHYHPAVRAEQACDWKMLQMRKPMLLLLFVALLLFRFETVQLLALLFQLPPRFTRLEPLADPCPIYSFATAGYWQSR